MINFYEVLRNVEVFETDGIFPQLQLSQDGQSHIVEGKQLSLHIDDGQSGVRIYLPHQEEDQAFTFVKLLPEKLFEWLMRDPNTQISTQVKKDSDGLRAMKDVFAVVRSRIGEALDADGIVTIDIENVDEEALYDQSEPISTATLTAAGEQDSRPSSIFRPQEDSEVFDTRVRSTTLGRQSPALWWPSSRSPPRNRSFSRDRPASGDRSSSSHIFPIPSQSQVPGQDEAADSPYLDLLGKIIAAARRNSLNQDVFSMNTLQESLPSLGEEPNFVLRSANQIERDCKIGAAGELFVWYPTIQG